MVLSYKASSAAALAGRDVVKNLDYGKNYEYPHEHPEHFIDVNYFPENVTESFYNPTKLGYEKYISERLSKLWRQDSINNAKHSNVIL